MPAHARNYRNPNEWRDLAQGVADRITKGPGSTHARVQWVQALLEQIGTQYYESGRADAQKEEAQKQEAVESELTLKQQDHARQVAEKERMNAEKERMNAEKERMDRAEELRVRELKGRAQMQADSVPIQIREPALKLGPSKDPNDNDAGGYRQ